MLFNISKYIFRFILVLVFGSLLPEFLLANSDNDSVLEAASFELSDLEGIDLVENERGQLHLRGTILRKSDLTKIDRFLRKYPEIKNDAQIEEGLKPSKSSAKPSATIFVEVALIEVKKSAFRSIGLRTSDIVEVESSFVNSPKRQFHLGTGDPVRAFLDVALQKGEAKIHAKQSLVAGEGKVGMFQVGGQFPIKTLSGPISKVEFMNYGLILKFKSSLISHDRAQLQIHSEISEIDMGSLIDGIPVVSKKELRTDVSIKLDEMMALGGLVQSSQANHSEGIPGLSQVPILGRLFRSEDFRRHRSEAYIFVHLNKMDQSWMPTPDL